MKGESLYTSRKPIYELNKHTLKQKLACEYNFLLFRVGGMHMGKLYNLKIPLELDCAINRFQQERKELIKILRDPKIRKDYMEMNQPKEKLK